MVHLSLDGIYYLNLFINYIIAYNIYLSNPGHGGNFGAAEVGVLQAV